MEVKYRLMWTVDKGSPTFDPVTELEKKFTPLVPKFSNSLYSSNVSISQIVRFKLRLKQTDVSGV